MPCKCGVAGCAEMFGDKVARREAKHFRKRGLSVRARRLLDALANRVPLTEKTALEVGAGIGGFTITMLERGVSRATIVDAAPAYVAAARTLATERGFESAMNIEVGNYAEDDAGEPADLIVMDRVVCCYPSWRGLLDRATGQARDAIALAYPKDTWYNRVGTALINVFMRLRRSEFRVFVHPPRLMHAFLESRGFPAEVVGRTLTWELVVARRSGATETP